jgi:hypothetical protein
MSNIEKVICNLRHVFHNEYGLGSKITCNIGRDTKSAILYAVRYIRWPLAYNGHLSITLLVDLT